ncbi:MAG: hypothetical protein J3K34DRAFT_517548 [Monoraphidium minutum]|nr:MAG: hypothetical protein J3K34DRAFT_517548 [Monoraphidium minutum]
MAPRVARAARMVVLAMVVAAAALGAEAAPPDYPGSGFYSLQAAAARWNVGRVKSLLPAGRDSVNARVAGWTPLAAALQAAATPRGEFEYSREAVQIASALACMGADPYAPFPNRDTGSGPMHQAAVDGMANIVLSFLRAGAAPNRANKAGVTPLGAVAQCRSRGTVDSAAADTAAVLLAYGADKNAAAAFASEAARNGCPLTAGVLRKGVAPAEAAAIKGGRLPNIGKADTRVVRWHWPAMC